MNPNQQNPVDPDQPQLPTIKIHHPSFPRHTDHPHPPTVAIATPTASDRRKIAVVVRPSLYPSR
ncbi:hypothetical protein RCOM_1256410 [Ricinus communis]|uniref:Uncharacterized protein n=1 Tax=Ricinus communis TaxID=3988 RepID=B9SIH4_RICCO|nr:hypothetical protein RCOM_1256410 [Ricinus communis]